MVSDTGGISDNAVSNPNLHCQGLEKDIVHKPVVKALMDLNYITLCSTITVMGYEPPPDQPHAKFQGGTGCSTRY